MPKGIYKRKPDLGKKISEARKGKCLGNTNAKGKRSKEFCENMSKDRMGTRHAWKGGCSDWWQKHLKKTYRECVLCKSPDKLEMHHRDHNRKNNKRHNQIILCMTCHHFWHDA